MVGQEPYYKESPVWYLKDRLRDIGINSDNWTNLGSDETSWIREGGALYAKFDGKNLKVITNYDLAHAVGGKEAEQMAETEGGRYRIHETRIRLDDFVEEFDSPGEMKVKLEDQSANDDHFTDEELLMTVISDLARQREDAMNVSNTNNFWDYMKSKYGITPPNGGE
jgi:hypothetical protein